MNQHLTRLTATALLLMAAVAAQAAPRTILMEKYSNGW